MLELIALIITLATVIMAWSRITSSLDWVGNRVEETTDFISDATQSTTMQTARMKILSKDTLLDDALESRKKNVSRTKVETKFQSGLTDDEKKSMSTHDKWLKDLENRY